MGKVVSSHLKEVRFFLFFIVFFLTAQLAHFFVRPLITPVYVHVLNAGVSSSMINMISPGEKTVAHGPDIISGNFIVSIEEGCEGIDGILLFIAAVLAFYAGIKEKIRGIIIGGLFLYIANLLRVITLYFISKYHPGYFDVMHVLIGQTYMIVISVILFGVWTNHLRDNQSNLDASEAC